MSKRRCTDMVALLPVIESLLTAGMSRRETADKPDPKRDRPVHGLLKRRRRKTAKGMSEFLRNLHKKTHFAYGVLLNYAARPFILPTTFGGDS